MGFLYEFFRNRSIYSRVHRINLVIAIVPMLIITFVSIWIYLGFSMRRLSENETNSLYHYVENLSNELYHMDTELVSLVQSDPTQALLKDYGIMNSYERFTSLENVRGAFMPPLNMLGYVTDVALVTNSYDIINVSNGPHDDFDMKNLDYVTLLRHTVNQSNKTLLAPAENYLKNIGYAVPNMNGFLYVKRIIDKETVLNNAGYLVVYIDKHTFFNFYSIPASDLSSLTRRYILSDTGSLIFSDANSAPAELPQLLDSLQAAKAQGVYSFRVAGDLYSTCVFWPLNVMGAYAVTVIPHTVFLSQVTAIVLMMIVVLVLLVTFSALLSSGIASSICVPIRDIHASLRAIEQNDFTVPPDDSHNDELANVRNLLNHTTSLLMTLIQQEKANEKQKFQLQFQALQAQMNPHFLVNTLNSVVWLSEIQGADNIRDLTHALINILNEILSNSDSYIVIKSELRFLEDYVKIQQYRYFDRFTLHIDVPDELAERSIPRFLLQPIIENSIIHGLDDSISFMTITLTIRQTDDYLRIEVTDNGVGMNSHQLENVRLLSETTMIEKPRGLASIGLGNINKRIHLMYGSLYGLMISSEYRHGTSVSITLPVTGEEATQ